MKKSCISIFLIFAVLIVLSGCIGKTSFNESMKETNMIKNNYDFNIAVKNARCIMEYPDTVEIRDFDTVRFGKYEQDGDLTNGKEDIEWIVVDKNNGCAKLISKYILDNVIYDDNSYKWENSHLRYWLNNIFYNLAFDETEQIIDTCTILRNDSNDRIYDKVFCLDNYDIEKYFSDNKLQSIDTYATQYAKSIVNNGNKISVNNYYSVGCSPYYTMIPSSGSFPDIVYVYPGDGLATGDGVSSGDIGVRPLIVVKYEDNNLEVAENNAMIENTQAIVLDNNELENQLKSISNLKIARILKRGDSIIEFPSIIIGKYEQDGDLTNGKEDIEWIVVDKDESNKSALLVSKYIIENKCYNEYMENELSWSKSSLRKFLNKNFFENTFSDNEKEIIIETINNNNCHFADPPMTIEYGTEFEKYVRDKIFILSYYEIEKYFNENYALFDNLACTSQGYPTKYAKRVKNNGIQLYCEIDNHTKLESCCYWVRDIGRTSEFASVISPEGRINTNGILVNSHTIGVRPAMWVKY